MVTAIWLAIKAGAGALLGKATANLALIGAVSVAGIGVMLLLHNVSNLRDENAALKAAVALHEAAAQAAALSRDLEEKALVEAAKVEKDNTAILDGWYAEVSKAPVVLNCVGGSDLERLRRLR